MVRSAGGPPLSVGAVGDGDCDAEGDGDALGELDSAVPRTSASSPPRLPSQMPRASIATMASTRGIVQRTLVPRLLLVLPGSSRCAPPWGAGAGGAGCGAGCQLAAPPSPEARPWGKEGD